MLGVWGAFDHELQLRVCCVSNAETSGQGTQGTVLPPSVAAKGMVNAAAPVCQSCPPALLAGSAGAEPQTQAANPAESLTFSVLPL